MVFPSYQIPKPPRTLTGHQHQRRDPAQWNQCCYRQQHKHRFSDQHQSDPPRRRKSAEAQTLSLAPGAFDDGLRLDYNGQTVLDFDFSNIPIFPPSIRYSVEAGRPGPVSGAPIVLELDARGLCLMVTATSNGTGTAAGVLTGQRVNVLNYFTSDTYVPDPADPDFTSGVQIGLYNRNNQGAWAISI